MKALACIGLLLTATAALVIGQSRSTTGDSTWPVQSHDLHVMLVVDTTGSMQPVLDSARNGAAVLVDQLRSQIHDGALHIGLVAYRDHGQSYVTQQCPPELPERLLTCLDGLDTGGGGDVPEAVLEGLQLATDILARQSSNSKKAIVLIGDAPGHQASASAIDALVQRSAGSGVVTHTLQWGGHRATRQQWRHIASLGNGHFAILNAEQPNFGATVAGLLAAQ